MLAKANIYGERKLKHPARIKECDVALDSVQNLLKCCKSLERLKS